MEHLIRNLIESNTPILIGGSLEEPRKLVNILNSLKLEASLERSGYQRHLLDIKIPELQKGMNATDQKQETPLHLAACLENTTIARKLITNGSDINAKNQDGRTPLHLAALSGKMESMKNLIDHGASFTTKILYAVLASNISSANKAKFLLSFVSNKFTRRSHSSKQEDKATATSVGAEIGVGFFHTDVFSNTPLERPCLLSQTELVQSNKTPHSIQNQPSSVMQASETTKTLLPIQKQ